jgi:hypothetical protein
VNARYSRLFVFGGMSGIVGTVAYVIAITVSLHPTMTYVMAMAWPILSIVFVFSLFRFIELTNPCATNQLAFVFACLAFTLVAGMMSIQLGVRIGLDEYITKSSQNQQELLELIRRSVRLVDMGLDVAWDLFIGTALVFLSFSLNGHDRFGRWWGVPSALLGATLIILNVLTFPWPPDSRDLFDVGPAIGLFIIALSIRLVLVGIRLRHAPTTQENIQN